MMRKRTREKKEENEKEEEEDIKHVKDEGGREKQKE